MTAIRVPVHILTGTADRIVDPNRHARPLAAALEGSRLTELEGIGHMPHHAAPDTLIEAVREAAAVA